MNFVTRKLRAKWSAEMSRDVTTYYATIDYAYINEKPNIGDYFYHNNLKAILYKNDYKNIIPNNYSYHTIPQDSLLLYIGKKILRLNDKKNLYHIFSDYKGNTIVTKLIYTNQEQYKHKLTKVTF